MTGQDVDDQVIVAGNGGATLFGHAAARLWWPVWSLLVASQYTMACHQGYPTVRDKGSVVAGNTYNLITN